MNPTAALFRVLQPLMDPAMLAAMGPQAQFLRVVDIVITGAVLGGGAEGLHRIISVFTDFLYATRARTESP